MFLIKDYYFEVYLSSPRFLCVLDRDSKNSNINKLNNIEFSLSERQNRQGKVSVFI